MYYVFRKAPFLRYIYDQLRLFRVITINFYSIE